MHTLPNNVEPKTAATPGQRSLLNGGLWVARLGRSSAPCAACLRLQLQYRLCIQSRACDAHCVREQIDDGKHRPASTAGTADRRNWTPPKGGAACRRPACGSPIRVVAARHWCSGGRPGAESAHLRFRPCPATEPATISPCAPLGRRARAPGARNAPSPPRAAARGCIRRRDSGRCPSRCGALPPNCPLQRRQTSMPAPPCGIANPAPRPRRAPGRSTAARPHRPPPRGRAHFLFPLRSHRGSPFTSLAR